MIPGARTTGRAMRFFRRPAVYEAFWRSPNTFPTPGRSKVDRAVRNYTHSVVSAEWPMLALRQNSPAAADDLNSLLVLLSSDEVTSVLNTSVKSMMLQQAVQARSMRDLRIALSHTHVNPLKWLGMAFLGFLTMISIAMVHVDRSRAELLAVLLFAAASAPRRSGV